MVLKVTKTHRAERAFKYYDWYGEPDGPLLWTRNNAPFIADDWTNGVELKDYRSIINSGGDATTNRTCVKHTYNVGDGYARASFGTWHLAVQGQYYSDFSFSDANFSISQDDVTNKAKGKFVKKSTNLITPLLGGVVVGELAKTLRMIRNPALSLRAAISDYLDQLKKVGRKRDTAFRRRSLNETYLEASFGWTPLLVDIQNGFEALNAFRDAKFNKPIQRLTVYSKAKESRTDDVIVQPDGWLGLHTPVKTSLEYSSRLSGGLLMSTAGAPASLADFTGFNLSSFIPSAWELLPYSFLIDYFTNIGDVINAYSIVDSKVTFLSLTERLRFRRELIPGSYLKPAPFGPLPPDTYVRPCTFRYGYQYLKRTKLGSVIPNLSVRLPGFGTKQMLNIASLIYQKGVPRPFY